MCRRSFQYHYKILDKVKFGDLVFIPNTTYDYMPNSRLGAEALVKSFGF